MPRWRTVCSTSIWSARFPRPRNPAAFRSLLPLRLRRWSTAPPRKPPRHAPSFAEYDTPRANGAVFSFVALSQTSTAPAPSTARDIWASHSCDPRNVATSVDEKHLWGATLHSEGLVTELAR